MKHGYMRCPRCLGQKKMYKTNGGYSAVDSGGPKVDCPMCLAEGEVKTIETAMKDIEDAKDDAEVKPKKGKSKTSTHL